MNLTDNFKSIKAVKLAISKLSYQLSGRLLSLRGVKGDAEAVSIGVTVTVAEPCLSRISASLSPRRESAMSATMMPLYS